MTGDTHGDFSRLRPVAFREQGGLTKDDYLIICGDFGGVWDGSEIEQQWLDWLEDRSFTTLFVSGNHENYDLLRSYPTSVWHGGHVQPIRPSVLHWTKQVGTWTTSSPTAAPAAFRTHSAAGCSNRMP